MAHLLVIVIGLVTGSFLNVVIDRIPRQESILWPGSHCFNCGQNLTVRDLIPVVSYFGLGGHCRYCRQKIKPRIPLVEVLAPLSFELVFLHSGVSAETAAGWIFSALLLTAAFTDLEEGLIPDLITYPGILIGLGLAYATIGLSSAVLGLMFFAGFLLGVALLSNGGMGGGDIKLAGVIGAFLGQGGAGMTLVISSVAGGLWAACLLAQGKADRKTAIKFGPFLAGAAWLVWIFGGEIIKWWLDLYA